LLYNNLIYFLVVILVINSSPAGESSQFLPSTALFFFLTKLALFSFALKRIFGKAPITSASRYAAAEKQGSILAIIFFSIDAYLLDSQFYFSKLPLAAPLPFLTSLAGLLLFTCYLALMWRIAQPSYQNIFGRKHNSPAFIWANLKSNLAIVLPWLILSLATDLLTLAPIPIVQRILQSALGEQLIIISFFGLLIIIFPALVIRLWNCSTMPASPTRSRIEQFCRDQKVEYRDIMIWPLFEGQALTAGVMGIVKRYRYLLVTPALLKALTPDELEAVMAHEIGHVKKKHLQLYMLLFLGFALSTPFIAAPLLTLLATSDLFHRLVSATGKEPGNTLAFISTLPFFLLVIGYFRYVVGFFMRNFERQADLHAMQAIHSSLPLIRVFEKIAWLSGNIRDLPSWHHFSIGQRIDFLKKSEADPSLIKKHDRKVYLFLIALLMVFVSLAATFWSTPERLMVKTPADAIAVINQKIKEDPANHVWYQLLGDLHYNRKRYAETIKAWEKCIELAPEHQEVLNNLAWLLLTSEDQQILDPPRALSLAREASILHPGPHILDTLALAYWMNGFPERAILTEQKAISKRPPNLDHYKKQLRKFQNQTPPEPFW